MKGSECRDEEGSMVIMVFEFEKKLKEIIASVEEGIEVEDINENTDLEKDFGFSSIDIIQLIIMIEEELDCIFEDNELVIDKVTNYKNLVEIINTKIGET